MALFNFIYKNNELIQSLYAQIFSGLLQSTETQETAKHREGGIMEGKIPPIVKGNLSSEDANEKTIRMVMDPHDAMLNDVLVTLAPRMKHDLSDVHFGDMIHIKGKLFVIPSAIERNGMDLLFEAFSPQIDLSKIPKNARSNAKSFIKKAIVGDEQGCRFLFSTTDDEIMRGVLNIENLIENQKELTFKYGIQAIPSEIVCLYEGGNEGDILELSQKSILGGLHSLSGMTNQIYLNGLPSSHPVKPIVIFYRINGTENIPPQPEA